MDLKWVSIFLLFTAIPFTISQTPATPEAPSPAADACNGVFLSYSYVSGSKLPPDNPKRQAYRFESTLTVLNNGLEELKSWKVFVGFQHDELLVSASNAVLFDGSSYPASVGNGTVLAGFPQTDLKTAVETAGDLTQMQVQVKMVGTQFGVKSPNVPMPKNISLANNGFLCPDVTMQGKFPFFR